MRFSTLLVLLFVSISVFAQNPWKKVNESTLSVDQNLRTIVPNAYETYQLDINSIKKQLLQAPMEDIQNTQQQGVIVELPLADGTTHQFEFVESPGFSPALAAKYPHIKSYLGSSVETPGMIARVDFDNYGFHGAINSPYGTMYIDKYVEEDSSLPYYISYFVADHEPNLEGVDGTCAVEDFNNRLETEGLKRKLGPRQHTQRSPNVPVEKITYRLAMACTGAWGSQQGGTVDAVLSKMNTGLTRLNLLMETEMAIKFELIDNNDQLIFFNSNEPYTSPNVGGTILGQNTTIINSRVGANAYDVGHVLTTRCTDVGGVAFGGSICGQNKAAGVSCVGNANIEFFFVTVTAHELGHQFAAGHTWNQCRDLNDQFAFASSCEPGSGNTILSYQGLCGPDNITGGDIISFHVCSINQMRQFVTNGNGATCGERELSDNNFPEVIIDQPSGFNIPISTPFELIGDATDADGDQLTFSWEQIDTGFPKDVGVQANDGPMFRVFRPGPEKTRIFPRLFNVLNGTDWPEERLPTRTREFNFNLVVRDNNPIAGGLDWATITFNSNESAGPFTVTEPGSFTDTAPGQTMMVEWDVANTDNDIINAQFVDIYFSTDGAETFPIILKERTPNDGSELINIPNVRTGNGKVKVKANDNIFFNIARGDVRVNEPTVPGFFVESQSKSFDICLPESVSTTINSTPFLQYGEEVTLEVISGLPAGAEAIFSQNPIPAEGSTELTIDMEDVQNSGLYDVVIRATGPDADTLLFNVSVLATGTNMEDFEIVSPTSGSSGILALPQFVWNGSVNATGYRLEFATNPSFDDDVILISDEVGLETTSDALTSLDNSTVYYWRVVAYNSCLGEVSSEIFTLATPSLSCTDFVASDVPITISSGGPSTVSSNIFVNGSGNVTDLNITNVAGRHNRMFDINAFLVSPSGTRIAVFSGGSCLNVSEFDAGFDDGAALINGCPNVNGRRMQPIDPFTTFAGEPIAGDWLLEIEDINAGIGGSLTVFEMELCSDGVVDNPFIVNNEVLEVRQGSANTIRTADLLIEDDNNSAGELIFTIVDLPSNGFVEFDRNRLGMGDQFTQADINANRIAFRHDGSDAISDEFTFTVIDGEGGWIDKTLFLINTSADAPTSTSDITNENRYFEIFPNPTNSAFQVLEKSDSNEEWTLEMLAPNGQIVHREAFVGSTSVETNNFTPGLYIVQLRNGSNIQLSKLSVIK